MKFVFIHDKAYLWYAFSILCSFAYLLFNYMQKPFHDYIFSENPFFLYTFSDPFLILHIIFYPLFITEFLHLKVKEPQLHRLINGFSIFFIVYIIMGVLYVSITKDLNTRVIFNQYLAATGGVVALYGIYKIFVIEKLGIYKPFSRIVLLGILFMLFFYVLSLVVGVKREHLNLNDSVGGLLHLDLLLIGNIVEISFFTVALGYRDLLIQKESEHAIRVRERLEKMTARTKLKSLLAQLDPHFTNNVINMIRHYVGVNPQEAKGLLTMFAHLARHVVENSRREFITVEEEIKTLQLYIQLQMARWKNQFSYLVNVDDEILQLCLPPMIVQPLVENAILHGLVPLINEKGVKKIVTVTFAKKEDFLYIGVEDNGNCLKAVATNRRSVGLSIVKDLLVVVWDDLEAGKHLKITEKKLPEQGVLAEIILPKKYGCHEIHSHIILDN